jgi:hypothetical protein
MGALAPPRGLSAPPRPTPPHAVRCSRASPASAVLRCVARPQATDGRQEPRPPHAGVGALVRSQPVAGSHRLRLLPARCSLSGRGALVVRTVDEQAARAAALRSRSVVSGLLPRPPIVTAGIPLLLSPAAALRPLALALPASFLARPRLLFLAALAGAGRLPAGAARASTAGAVGSLSAGARAVLAAPPGVVRLLERNAARAARGLAGRGHARTVTHHKGTPLRSERHAQVTMWRTDRHAHREGATHGSSRHTPDGALRTVCHAAWDTRALRTVCHASPRPGRIARYVQDVTRRAGFTGCARVVPFCRGRVSARGSTRPAQARHRCSRPHSGALAV